MNRQKSYFHAFQDRVKEKDYEISQRAVGMDEKMQKRIEALSRMTTKNGASINEAEIAQRKLQALKEAELRKENFAARMKSAEKPEPTKVNIYPMNESIDPQDMAFRNNFEELKKANRKRWNIK